MDEGSVMLRSIFFEFCYYPANFFCGNIALLCFGLYGYPHSPGVVACLTAPADRPDVPWVNQTIKFPIPQPGYTTFFGQILVKFWSKNSSHPYQ